jgi:hypothetical protein
MSLQIDIDQNRIADFCHRWSVATLALFGSVLRDDFDPERSDVDVLVEFEAGARIGLIEFARMGFELEEMFGRRVDLVSKNGLKPRLRREVLGTAQVVYAAA